MRLSHLFAVSSTPISLSRSRSLKFQHYRNSHTQLRFHSHYFDC